MNEFGLLDYLMVIGAVALSWGLYYATLPPPGDGKEPTPAALRAASLGLVGWADTMVPPEGTAGGLEAMLPRIAAANGYRDITPFIEGARLAYETIVTAYAQGEIAAEAYLLSPVVRRAFEEAIAARKARGETMEMLFIGIRTCEIIDAGLTDKLAWIDVRFVGEMVSSIRDGEGKVVAGDPGRVEEVPEIWSFERQLGAAGPNWLLVATEAEA